MIMIFFMGDEFIKMVNAYCDDDIGSTVDVLERLVDRVSVDVDYVDVRFGRGVNSDISMKDGRIQDINTGFSLGVQIRVLKNGAWGSSFTNDLGKLDGVSRDAIKIADALCGDVVLSDECVVRDEVESGAKILPSHVSIDEKKSVISEVNDASLIGDVVSTNVRYNDSESTSVFLSNEGSCIISENSRIGLFLNAVASTGEIIQMGHGSIGGTAGFEILQKTDLEKFGRNIGQKASNLLKAETAPSGKFPIITDSELTGVFIHEALGHASEADLILQDDSILKGELNNQIGSPLVTIIDDPTIPQAFGHYKYDAEGVKTQKNTLVENGILKSLLSSRETAAKFNTQSSGNARSNISDQPIVRMSNTYLQPGDMSFTELIEDIKDGVYLKGSRGGQVDTGKGIFQFNASESYKIENGEITTSLRDVSLSGNIMETLNNINGIGKDFKLSVGFCGKSGQVAPVGDGGPHTRILNAMVGGSN